MGLDRVAGSITDGILKAVSSGEASDSNVHHLEALSPVDRALIQAWDEYQMADSELRMAKAAHEKRHAVPALLGVSAEGLLSSIRR